MRTVAAPCFRRVMQASVASAALPFAACLSSRLLVGLTRISVLALLLSYVASLPLARATPSPNERSNQAMSQIVVIRHAPAEDREAAHRQGRPKMTHVAAGLHRTLALRDLVASSPLKRAVETAAIVAEAFAPLTQVECEALVPQAHPEELLDWLRSEGRGCVAVVGHDPDLSAWVSWALTGDTIPLLRLKKGGACLLEFPGGKWRAGEAILQWMLTPTQLAQLGGQ